MSNVRWYIKGYTDTGLRMSSRNWTTHDICMLNIRQAVGVKLRKSTDRSQHKAYNNAACDNNHISGNVALSCAPAACTKMLRHASQKTAQRPTEA